MAAQSKLTSEILEKIKKLIKEGLNNTEIANSVGFSRQTIEYWLKKHSIKSINKKTRAGYKQKHDIFIQEIKKHGSPKTASEKAGIKSNGQYLIKKYNLTKYIKGRSIPKLSLEEAQSRIPNCTDKIIGFDSGKYQIKTIEGYKYEKTSSKLHQGDPRGKSGNLQTIDDICCRLKELGYTYCSGYVNTHKSFQAICNKCNNTRTARIENFKNQSCPSCSNIGVSQLEEEIKDYIQDLGFKTIKYRFKGKTKGKEIDIYIPELNLGIEFCGLYWHCDKNKPDRNYHFDKMKQCEENNIRLITIFEDEWLERNSQVKNYLKSALGVADRRMYARKCEIFEVNKNVAKCFLEENHIQGKTTFKKAFGLYHNEELVGLVTSNTHHRQGHSDTNVLNRLVFADGVCVVGGASKLLKHLIKYSKEQNYKKLISWSDSRWSQGNVYEKIGFYLQEELKPDYSYYVGNSKRQSKQSNKKVNLIKKGAKGDMSMTEKELALTLNYRRIWDCGKKRWEIIL